MKFNEQTLKEEKHNIMVRKMEVLINHKRTLIMKPDNRQNNIMLLELKQNNKKKTKQTETVKHTGCKENDNITESYYKI